jgi:hypothetical protein
VSVESITCIYCLKEKPQTEFNREHVLPDSFGKFTNALVLHDMVCKECNQYFGDTLDIVLARGSMQGAMRYLQNVKPLTNFDQSIRERVKLAARSKYDRDFREAEFVKTPEGEGLAFTPGLVYFSKLTGKEIFVSLKELETGKYSDIKNLDSEQPVILSCRDEDTKNRFQEALKLYNKGIEVMDDIPGPQKGEKVLVAVDAIMEDDLVNRAVAKVAFNYLAYTQGKEFVERPIFNPIRSYIHKGASKQKFVKRINPIKLFGDTQEAKRRKGHVTLVDLSSDKRTMIGIIEFFSTLAYQVNLGAYENLTIPLSAGHYYDNISKEVKKMDSYRLPNDFWIPGR